MTSTIIPTLKCCIDSIQLKLYDCGMEKIDFEKILNERVQSTETPRNVNKNLSLLEDNHFQYVHPVCPNCNSKKVTKQRFHEIYPIIDDSKPFKDSSTNIPM